MGCRTVIKKFITNCTPTCPDVEDWVFSNANVTGEGVFYQQVGTAVEFYGITNTDGYITVSLDAANKVISIDIDPDLIAGSIPDATTTVKGKVELSTDAEAQAKTDTARALTPSNLAALGATTTATGLVELATNAETITGTDTERATTPAGVKAAMDATKALVVVANAAARAAATPTYIGQQLYQVDTSDTYSGTSLASGGWSGPAIKGSGTTIIPSGGSPVIQLDNGEVFIFYSSTADGQVFFTDVDVAFANGGTVEIAGRVVLQPLSTKLSLGGPDMDALSLLGTSATAGQPTSYLLSAFLGSNSATEAYTITNDITTRTYDADTVTTAVLADVVATLIKDIEALKRPVA